MNAKFKVGDKVRCIDAKYTAFFYGQLFIVEAITSYGELQINKQNYRANRFELVTEPKFKVGDRVTFLDKDLTCYGTIYTFAKVSTLAVIDCNDGLMRQVDESRLTLIRGGAEPVVFEVGDKVSAFGLEGVVVSPDSPRGGRYPVYIEIVDDGTLRRLSFTLDGKDREWHKTPSLTLIEKAAKVEQPNKKLDKFDQLAEFLSDDGETSSSPQSLKRLQDTIDEQLDRAEKAAEAGAEDLRGSPGCPPPVYGKKTRTVTMYHAIYRYLFDERPFCSRSLFNNLEEAKKNFSSATVLGLGPAVTWEEEV